jgi:hypothetical protein
LWSQLGYLDNVVILNTTLATEGKISHLVASLPTSRQQVVCLSQVVNKFGTSCQQLVTTLLLSTTCNNIFRLVTRLFQQVRYSDDIRILLQPCVVNLVTFLLYHDCIRLVSHLVTSLIMASSLLQVVNGLFQTSYNKSWSIENHNHPYLIFTCILVLSDN